MNEKLETKEVSFAEDNSNAGKKSRNILLLGLVSLFVDMSTEMVYPIIPLFLVTLGTAPYIIGVIEGIAESVAALLRSFAGYITDKRGARKPFAIVGYSASIFYKLGLLLSTTWVGVLFSRIVDRTGKGLRTAPRDSLIAESGDKKLGRSFGLHKMFDTLGAALGVLLAFVILSSDFEFKTVIVISMIPAAIGVIILCFVKELKKERVEIIAAEKTKMKLDKKLLIYFIVIFIFGLGKSSNAFLLLKAQSGGFDSQSILLLYLLSHFTASLFSIPFGRLSDRLGRKTVIVASYIVYALVYFGFALFTGTAAMILLFGFYGVFTAMISGAEKAMLVEMAPKEYKGTVLGLYGTMQGLGLLLSSTIAGFMWTFAGENSPFFFGGILAVAAAVCMLIAGIGGKKESL